MYVYIHTFVKRYLCTYICICIHIWHCTLYTVPTNGHIPQRKGSGTAAEPIASLPKVSCHGDGWCVARDGWCVARDGWCVARDGWCDGVSQESCLDSSNRPKRNAPEMHFSQTGANAEK